MEAGARLTKPPPGKGTRGRHEYDQHLAEKTVSATLEALSLVLTPGFATNPGRWTTRAGGCIQNHLHRRSSSTRTLLDLRAAGAGGVPSPGTVFNGRVGEARLPRC